MKKLVLFFAIALVPIFVFGRSTKIGIKGGLYISSIPSELATSVDGASLIALNDKYTGYHFGVVGSFVFPGFFIQPELLFVSTGRDMQIDFADEQQADEFFTQKFQHMALPVLIGMKIGPLKLGVGPVFSVSIGQGNDSITFSNLRHQLHATSLGYQIGAGVQLGSLLLEARHESNLTRYGEGISVGGQHFDFDMRPSQFILSIGLLF